VVFDDYSTVPGGHVAPGDPRYDGPVIGVPIRLDAHIIGACIVFGSRPRRFDAHDVELLELFATHASVAIANSRLHTLLAERRQAVAVAAERERAVLDVHDSVARSMASVMVHLDEAGRQAESGHDARPPLRRAREAVRQALVETELSADTLSPEPADVMTVEEQIAHELDWVASTAGVRTQLVVVGERRSVPRDTARELLRMVQEALTNVVAHARADSVRVGLVHSPDSVGVIVEDDGIGFDGLPAGSGAPETLISAGRWGLSGLSARARQIGGTVQIDSTPSWGTRVRVDLPSGDTRPTGSTTPRRRVVVVHGEPLVRAGVVRLLGRAEPGLRVVAEFADPAIALNGIGMLRPDVVVADIDLGGMSGAEFVADVARVHPAAALVFLVGRGGRNTAAGRDRDTSTRLGGGDDDRVAMAALAGARGFVDRGADAVSLGRAVVAAADGDAVLSGDLVSRIGTSAEGRPEVLTAREREVRALVARGLPDKQIAARLGISPKTVEKHVGTVLRKTGARNRTELASMTGERRIP